MRHKDFEAFEAKVAKQKEIRAKRRAKQAFVNDRLSDVESPLLTHKGFRMRMNIP